MFNKSMGSKGRYFVFGAAALLALALVGCKSETDTLPGSVAGKSKVNDLYVPEAEAGVSLDAGKAREGLDTVQQIAARRTWGHRGDPFALLSAEAAFDREQSFERILSESGGYSMMFETPEVKYDEDRPTIEPQPAWRLAGIAVSEGAVMALLDTGTTVDTIRPGQPVAGTEWTCVSIDEERAIFRRPGSALPKEISVELGAPLGGGGGAAGPGSGSGNGQPGAGGRFGGPGAPGGGGAAGGSAEGGDGR